MTARIAIEIVTERTPLVARAVELIGRRVAARAGLDLAEAPGAAGRIVLARRPDIGPEGYSIADGTDGAAVRVEAADDRGLLYGVGRLLRDAACEPGVFRPGPWRGASVPKCPVRGMYFASHFHNFYHDAPVEAVEQYVGELALWGLNSLMVWYDMHHFTGIADPAAQAMIRRLRAVLAAAKGVGMKVGLCLLGNEAYASSPPELRADSKTGRAHYQVELCPSKPAARDLMLRGFEEEFRAFADLGLDQIWIWPYDQGGCACADCAPWGANGFLRIAEPVARLFRRYAPAGKVILSTWLFDYGREQGEWAGLAKAFARKPDWCDYILAESHGDFPRYPLEHGLPGGLPALNFPEISMWAMWPWGGYGATPLPDHFQAIWDQGRRILSGGFPYSEGIFEDINKVIFSQFYWDPERPALDTLREYAAYEFSPAVADDVVKAARLLEKYHPRKTDVPHYGGYRLVRGADGGEHGAIRMRGDASGVDECWTLLEAADRKLAPVARTAWRWRILLLRGLIDRELKRGGGVPSRACEEAFEELIGIYHAGAAETHVCPPSRAAIRRLDPENRA